MPIREATEEDSKAIADLFRIESAKKPYFQEWTEDAALEKIKGAFKSDKIYVFEEEGKIIGFAICQIEKSEKEVYIWEMWFLESFQGKGLGSQLLEYIEEGYRKKGFKSLSLVSDKNSRAFQFYKKKGFKNHEKFVFMEKKL